MNTLPLNAKCMVFGCTNLKYNGQFVGPMCAPCYHYLTTGTVGPTDSFLGKINELESELRKCKIALSEKDRP